MLDSLDRPMAEFKRGSPCQESLLYLTFLEAFKFRDGVYYYHYMSRGRIRIDAVANKAFLSVFSGYAYELKMTDIATWRVMDRSELPLYVSWRTTDLYVQLLRSGG